MNNVDIDRINELYHKSKSVGLTKAEEAEQKKLRKAYLTAIRKNLRGSLVHEGRKVQGIAIDKTASHLIVVCLII